MVNKQGVKAYLNSVTNKQFCAQERILIAWVLRWWQITENFIQLFRTIKMKSKVVPLHATKKYGEW
jgi:hypothetical protein